MLDCREPDKWPSPPEDMTFSALKAMEACARQWALQNADYAAVWGRKGYPPKIAMAALVGTIAHSIVEILTREFVAAGCTSVHDTESVNVMRRLGGYGNVISRAIDVVVESCRENPRGARVVEAAERTLRAKAPEIRGQVQALLSQVGFSSALAQRSRRSGGSHRGALPQGVYSEFLLRAPRIRWKGKVDLLAIDGSGCEIVEFKTGQASSSHTEQLRMYAALWWMDEERNPAGTAARKLSVIYPSRKEVVIPPTGDGLQELANEMARRGASAMQSVSSVPPVAKPAIEVCRYCGVRQLCAEYWAPGSTPMVAFGEQGVQLADVQALIDGRHGATSWDARVEIGTGLEPNTRILIRAGSAVIQMEKGQRIRIIDGWMSQDAESPQATKVVTLTAASEVFRIG